MINTDILVVGGGPAGLSAAITAAEGGAKVIVLERDDMLGGQLVKQTHMFFGSKNEFAGTRGVSIAEDLRTKISKNDNVQVMLEATAQGYYDDGVIGVSHEDRFKKINENITVINIIRPYFLNNDKITPSLLNIINITKFQFYLI